MKNRIVFGILFFLTLITSSVFASMVENSRQGLPAISAEMQPTSTLGNAEQHQGLTRVLLELLSDSLFITKDPIGFRGGRNLWVYVSNNPTKWVDPFGLLRKLILRLFLQDTNFTANLSQMELYFGFLGSRGPAWDVVSMPLPPEYNSETIGYQSGYFGCGDEPNEVVKKLSEKFGKPWNPAEANLNIFVSPRAVIPGNDPGISWDWANLGIINITAGISTTETIAHEAGHLLGLKGHLGEQYKGYLMYEGGAEMVPVEKGFPPFQEDIIKSTLNK